MSPDDTRRQWLRTSNIRTLVLTTLMTIVVLAPSAGVARDPVRVYDLSLAVALLYGVLHGGMLLHVRRLSVARDDASVRAAALLRDPRRITSLDLAAYWVGLAEIGPMLMLRP